MTKKRLKEQCDIDGEDEVQEITTARNPMNKIKALYGHLIKRLQ